MPQHEPAPQHGTTLPPQYNTLYPTPDVQTAAAAPNQEYDMCNASASASAFGFGGGGDDMFNADGTFK